MFAHEGRLVASMVMARLDTALWASPLCSEKEGGGIHYRLSPPAHRLHATSPCHIPTLPSHAHGLCSTVRAGMEPIRTNSTGRCLPVVQEPQLPSTLQAASWIKGAR